MIAHQDGHRLLPRLIRYIEERRRNERRFTGAIERHPSPLAVVWGPDDPIAVPAMVDRLARPGPTPPSPCSTGSGTTRWSRPRPVPRRPGRDWPGERPGRRSRRGQHLTVEHGEPTVGARAHRRQAAANDARSSGVAIPWASSCSARTTG